MKLSTNSVTNSHGGIQAPCQCRKTSSCRLLNISSTISRRDALFLFVIATHTKCQYPVNDSTFSTQSVTCNGHIPNYGRLRASLGPKLISSHRGIWLSLLALVEPENSQEMRGHYGAALLAFSSRPYTPLQEADSRRPGSLEVRR